MSQRFQTLSHLGRGGVGSVNRCWDTRNDCEVAVKRLLPLEKTKLNESASESLRREVAALGVLDHPNVAKLIEFGEDEDGIFVATELVEGERLDQVVRKGAISVDDFYDLAKQILDVLAAAQKVHLIHRDIKPANIILKWLPEGGVQAKILDFGLSKITQRPMKQTLDVKGHFMCSVDYVAPEQIERGLIDHRVDFYSLACVLYFCLAQRPPFRGDSNSVTLNSHLKRKFTPIRQLRPDLPRAVARWLERMMALEPNDRPKNAILAKQELINAKEFRIAPVSQVSHHAPVEKKKEIEVTPRPQKHAAVPKSISKTEIQTIPISPKTIHSEKVEVQKKLRHKMLLPLVGASCVALFGILAFSVFRGDTGGEVTGREELPSAKTTEISPAGEASENEGE